MLFPRLPFLCGNDAQTREIVNGGKWQAGLMAATPAGVHLSGVQGPAGGCNYQTEFLMEKPITLSL